MEQKDEKPRGGITLRRLVAEDEVVAKRGKPGLPKLKFMEGPGPDDPRFQPQAVNLYEGVIGVPGRKLESGFST